MRNLFIFAFLISLNICIAQKKGFNVVILVDGEVVKYTNGKILTESVNNLKETINCNIVAGEIYIDKLDSIKLFSKNVSKLTFEFETSKLVSKEVEYYYYSIEDFKIQWLKDYFFVLYIYNTDNKKYKKEYFPLEGKNYTYEYDSPSGSIKRVKRAIKK
jgi:hypothetical protein